MPDLTVIISLAGLFCFLFTVHTVVILDTLLEKLWEV